MGGHRRVDGAARHSRGDAQSAYGAEQSALERLHVRRVHAQSVGDASRQDIAENPEAGAKHGVGCQLPRDCRSRLEDGQGRGSEQVAEVRLNRRVQRLIDIMGNRTE